MSAVPRRGAFAAMTIDPHASLAHVEAPSHLRDELCSQVESQTYVVYISDVSPDLYEHGERGGKPQSRFHRRPHHQPPAYRDVTVEFLLQGLPPTSPALSIDSGMSIPIFPALHHPHHREPLQPSHLLPFRNSYLAPFVAARVRVAAGAAPPAGATYCLSKPEQLRHDTWFETDRRRREEALVHRASIARGADAYADVEVPPTPTSPGAMSTRPQRGSYMPLYGAQAAARWSDSETMRLSAEEEREEKEDVVVNGSLYRNAGGAEGGVRHSGLSVVFSYDFAGVGELRSPVEFFEEGERMGWIAQSLRYQSAISGDDGESSSHDTRTVVDSLKAPPRLLAKLVAAGKSTVRRLLLPSSTNYDTPPEKRQMKMTRRGRASAYL